MFSHKPTLVSGLFGNALEWYDFILYANFVPVFAKLFFPVEDPTVSLLLTLVVFATGFIVRPLGAALFGYIGDHWGRRIALIISISLITFPTLLIGFIPTYASIGFMAPLLLTLLRLFQGVAVSGELNSASNFLIEHASHTQRGLAGSLVMGVAFLGIFMGALASSLSIAMLSTDTLYAWGWRIPFWAGGVLGVVGLFLRLRAKESPKFLQEKNENKKRHSIKEIFHTYRKELLLTIALTSVMAVGNYIFIAYIVTFLTKLQGFTLEDANFINLISMFIVTLLFPLMGMLSDKIGRKPVFKTGLWGFVLFSFPVFWLLSQKQLMYVLIGDLLFGILLVPIAGLIPTILAEIFPTSVRNTGTALGYNICLAIFGGTAPLVSLGLVHITGSTFAPAAYLISCAVLSFIALCFIEETHHSPLR